METPFKIAFAKGNQLDIRLELVEFDSFQDFAQVFKTPQPGEKGQVGYFVRGGDVELYPEYTTVSGTLHTDIHPRCDAALQSALFLVIDADKGKDGPAPHILEIHEKLKLLGINHFGYTSSTHTEARPKCRVVVPCYMPDKSYLSGSMSALQNQLDSVNCPSRAGGSEDYTWSNPWFIATEHENSQFVEYYDGKDFEAVAPSSDRTALEIAPNGSSGRSFTDMLEVAVTGEGDTGTHGATRDLIWQLKCGLPNESIIQLMEFLFQYYDMSNPRHIENFNKIRPLVESAAKKLDAKWPTPTPLPNISDLYDKVQFPAEVLPESIKDAAQEIADYCLMEATDIYPILLVVICMSINRKAKIQVFGEDVEVFFSMSIFCIAKSGRFKSTVYDKALKGFKAADIKMIEEHKKTAPLKALQIKKLDAAINTKDDTPRDNAGQTLPVSVKSVLASALAKQPLLDEREALLQERVPGAMVDDVTQERNIVKCFLAGGATNFIADEGQGIISSWSDKYNKGKSSTDFALRGMTGSEYRYDRKGSSEINFRPVISSIIFVQPDVYEEQFLSNRHIYSSGMAARIIPIYWQEPNYENTEKTKDNEHIDVSKMETYWNITERLMLFDDRTVPARYSTDEPKSLNLIMPVTKIVVSQEDKHKSRAIFNKLWKRYAPNGDLAGKNEVLNKCLTLAHVMASSIYAYANNDTFFTTKEHKAPPTFFNIVNILLDYLLKKKLIENDIKIAATKLKYAERLLGIFTGKYRDDFVEGATLATYTRAANLNRLSTAEAEDCDAALYMLITHNYVHIENAILYLNPKVTKDNYFDLIKAKI